MPGFTHLHTASGFSLRYGASLRSGLPSAPPNAGWMPSR